VRLGRLQDAGTGDGLSRCAVWWPVRTLGGYGACSNFNAAKPAPPLVTSCGYGNAFTVHGHDQVSAWSSRISVADLKSFRHPQLCLLCGVTKESASGNANGRKT
jgi:hypothetical protein